MNIAVTGYVGTGSSAMIDLLREYDDVSIVPEQRKSYEHEVFYRSGGLFDLCAILGQGTSPVCSDKIINRFIDTMTNLYKYDYVWYGGYKNLLGDDFLKSVDDFVNAISYSFKGSNSTHQIRTRFSLTKALLQFAAHIVFKRSYMKYGVGYVMDGKPSFVSLPTNEELVHACQKFTDTYFSLFKTNTNNRVFDHLIWPQQVDSFMKCFDEDKLKVIIMKRDPRDVYLLNKYVWYYTPLGVRTSVPSLRTNVDEFITDWQRTVRKSFKSNNILQIQFEDLVYHYDETVHTIEEFLGILPTQHIRKYNTFNPEKSIENTQVYNSNLDWKKEVRDIEEKLKQDLYTFPYEYSPTRKLMFD